MEYHPRIDISMPILKESKIILGSFPTWSLTAPDLDKNETINDKKLLRIRNRDIPYFYGSSTNKFWVWYKEYIDNKILKRNIDSIKHSLKDNSIGITDIIISCNRKNKSSLDKHLSNRTYNYNFFEYPKKGDTIKILCTSKGVMNEMLLSKNFFKTHSQLKIHEEKSFLFQRNIIHKFNGDLNIIKNPFCKVINVKSGGTLECISLPSPGSPYRRLKDFGLASEDNKAFLNDYLTVSFNWFIS